MKIKKEKIFMVTLLVLTVMFVSVWGNIGASPADKIKTENEHSISEKFYESLPTNMEVNESEAQSESEVNAEITQGIKGVWISYLSLISGSEDDFKSNFINLAEKAKKKGLTDLFVHVRPFMDSMFESEYFPVSHLINGEQGSFVSFDALKFMIDETHKQGMKFHAWINPLRIKTASTPIKLSDNSVYAKYIETDPYFFIETETVTCLNPAYSFTRELVSNGIREIVNNYDVDGIHFDDYFYPSDYNIDNDSAYALYLENTENPLSAQDWMGSNINSLVSLCYQASKSSGKDVLFGISPQGNIENNTKIGADVKHWCETIGYIDYICPQLYWSYENPALGFKEALESWMRLDFHNELKMYAGLALYKVGTESDSSTWGDGIKIIYEQQKDALNKGAQGYVLYEISQLDLLI